MTHEPFCFGSYVIIFMFNKEIEMTVIKVTKRNISPTPTQLAGYKVNKTIQRAHVPTLRFGKLAVAADADVDG